MVAKLRSVSFEEALSLTGFGKFNFLIQVVNVSIVLGMAFETVSVAYLVPASACELDTTVSQQGLMAGVPLLGVITTSHFWGYLADTKGRRRILVWCLFVSFLFGAAAALSPDWIVFSVLKFLSSCTVAGTFALALTLVSEVTPQHKRACMVTLSSAIYVGSTGLMAVISIPVLQLQFSHHIPLIDIQFTPWRLLCVVLSAPCLFGALCAYFSYESPRYLLSIGEENKALEVLKGIYKINTGKSADDYNVSSLVLGESTGSPSKGLWSSMVSQTIPLLKPPLLKNTILMSVMFVIIYFGFSPFITWLPYIADAIMKSVERGEENLSFCDMLRASHNETGHGTQAVPGQLSDGNIVAEELQNQDCSLNTSAMLTVFAITSLVTAVSATLSGVIDSLGRKRTLICVQLISGVAGLCVNLPNSWVVSSILLVLYVLGEVNFGFLTTFSVDLFPTYVKAMAVCLTLMMGRGSCVLGINVLKQLLVHDCELSFYVFGGLTFVGGLVAFLLPGDTRTPEKDPVET